jgi:hypothetical protein
MGGADDTTVEKLRRYALNIGLAFQVRVCVCVGGVEHKGAPGEVWAAQLLQQLHAAGNGALGCAGVVLGGPTTQHRSNCGCLDE